MTQKERFDLVVFKFIDAHLDQHGYINAKIICAQFNMHRTGASKFLTAYRNKKPSNTRYDVTLKQHNASYTFQKVFLSGSSFEYLNAVENVFDTAVVNIGEDEDEDEDE